MNIPLNQWLVYRAYQHSQYRRVLSLFALCHQHREETLAEFLRLMYWFSRKSKSRNRNGLFLYRSGLTIANCALPDAIVSDRDKATNVVGIENPVGDCIDFLCSNNGETTCTRGKLCLHFPSSSISNTALSSSDAAFFLPDANESCSEEAVETALQIRVDSVRLAQALSGRYDSGHALTEDTCWSAVECVLSCFIESLTLDGSVPSTPPKRKTASSDGDWRALLDSDFDKAYRSEAGSSLYFGPSAIFGFFHGLRKGLQCLRRAL